MEKPRTTEDSFAMHRDALQIELGDRVLAHMVVVEAPEVPASDQTTE